MDRRKSPGLGAAWLDLEQFSRLNAGVSVAHAMQSLPEGVRQAFMGAGPLAEATKLFFDVRSQLQRAEAAAVVVWSRSDPEKFEAWFDEWKEDPDLEFIQLLLEFARVDGVALFQSDVAATKHARTREAVSRIPEMWETLKRDGMSKNAAKNVIAGELSLSPETVRKKLQGL